MEPSPFRCATPGATDVDVNEGLQSPLTDVEKAFARVAKHLPDTDRDALLIALHTGCVDAFQKRLLILAVYFQNPTKKT